MRFLSLLSLILVCSISAWAQEASYIEIPLSKSSADSILVMEETKVVGELSYLTTDEKEIIQWLNIARMYPKWFLRFRKIKNLEPVYTKTLIATLLTMKPIKEKLAPSKRIYVMAECHARTSGKLGHMGHDRQDPSCKREISAECIHYGSSDPAHKVERLLIDKGVPNLGHRNTILNRHYKLVGVSIAPFTSQNLKELAVIDFGI